MLNDVHHSLLWFEVKCNSLATLIDCMSHVECTHCTVYENVIKLLIERSYLCRMIAIMKNGKEHDLSKKHGNQDAEKVE